MTLGMSVDFSCPDDKAQVLSEADFLRPREQIKS